MGSTSAEQSVLPMSKIKSVDRLFERVRKIFEKIYFDVTAIHLLMPGGWMLLVKPGNALSFMRLKTGLKAGSRAYGRIDGRM